MMSLPPVLVNPFKTTAPAATNAVAGAAKQVIATTAKFTLPQAAAPRAAAPKAAAPKTTQQKAAPAAQQKAATPAAPKVNGDLALHVLKDIGEGIGHAIKDVFVVGGQIASGNYLGAAFHVVSDVVKLGIHIADDVKQFSPPKAQPQPAATIQLGATRK